MGAEILTIPILSDNYCCLVIDEGGVICVDPGESKPISRILRERDLTLDAILVTHEDHDHIGGVPSLADHFKCPVYGPGVNEIPDLTDPVEGGMELNLVDQRIQVMATPGHRSADLSFYFPGLNAVFCGDTLFTGGCGRMCTGNPELFWTSIQTLNRLPSRTQLFCGHEYALENYQFASELTAMHVFVERYEWARQNACSVPTTLEEERRSNIFLRAGDPAIAELCGLHGKPPWEVFAHLRGEKDRFQSF